MIPLRARSSAKPHVRSRKGPIIGDAFGIAAKRVFDKN